MICPSCQASVREGLRFCEDCGAQLDSLRCAECGAPVSPGKGFCGRCGSTVGEAAPPESRPTAEPLPEHPTSFAEGRYEVKRLLGEGGKKTVYLTHDSKLDRDVAFALIKTEGQDDAARARITREAHALGRLGDHPHVMPIYDVGQEDGQTYMVLPYMPGDVEGVIEQAEEHRLPLDRAIDIANQVCLGLEFAHSKGIIHRDLKPGNVLLTEDGTAKIGDFGLAVNIDRSRLTQEGMMVGTFSYMPPEQAMGGDVTPQADLYSLGAMLYEMVTGRPPFVGVGSVAIIGQHLNTPPVAPTWHNPEVPRGLEALILRLLEKDPKSRPGSAAEVREAMESIDLSPREATAEDAAPAGPDPVYRRTFVGREAELRRLHTAFDNAMSGNGSLVMVVGEPGIGKTSLCEQIDTYVNLRGGTTLVGHCYEEGSISLPYLAFVEAMRSYVLAREPEDLKSAFGSGATEVARIVSEVREKVEVEPREPGDPEEDRYRLMHAVTTFLRNAATVQPLLIVLEDLHDADRGTLEMLTHVARNLSDARLLIVATYRDVQVDRAHPLSGALAELRRVESFDRIGLRGLTADEVQRMMTSIAGPDLPWGISEAVHRQTEGNPLFVQEVLRDLVEEGILAREGGRPTRQTPPEMRIPEGLRDFIGKRMSRLSSECNTVLGMAAVIGREFPLRVLEQVADMPEADLFAALEEAQAAAMIEEQPSARGGVSFRFTHALFRQALYEETFAPRRLRLHQQVGRALEEVYEGRPEEHAAELAEHFGQSTEREDLQKALSYGEMAAERAIEVYAWSDAVGHLERSLQVQEVIDPDDKAKRCDLLLALGAAVGPAGRPMRCPEELAPEALALAEALDDNRRAFGACQMAMGGIMVYGQGALAGGPQWRPWAERADRLAEPGTGERVSADWAVSQISLAEGRLTEAWDLRLGALELARQLDDSEALFMAAAGIVRWWWAPQHVEVQISVAKELADHVPEILELRGSFLLLETIAWTLLVLGERERAQELWRQFQERVERTRHPVLLMYVSRAHAFLATLDGRLEQAVASSDYIRALGEEFGAQLAATQLTPLASTRPLIYLGRADEALAALAGDPEQVEITAQVAAASAQVMCRAHIGLQSEAQTFLRQVMDEAGITPEDDETEVQTLQDLLESAVVVGDRDAADVLALKLAGLAHLSILGGLRSGYSCTARHLGGSAGQARRGTRLLPAGSGGVGENSQPAGDRADAPGAGRAAAGPLPRRAGRGARAPGPRHRRTPRHEDAAVS